MIHQAASAEESGRVKASYVFALFTRFLSMSQSNMVDLYWLAEISPGTVVEDRLAYSRFPWISHGS
jgi:hypothetical protein